MKPDKTLSEREKFEWLELWERAGDDRLSPEESKLLNDALKNRPEVVQLIAEAAWIGGQLRADGEISAVLASLPEPTPIRTTWRWVHGLTAAAAAITASAISVWAWNTATQPDWVATLEKAQGCKWGNSALPTLEGSRLPAGRLDLAEGLATLRFDSGATVILEAPVSLDVLSAMECRVERGTVVADVPPPAIGFTIHTQDTKVVDYGTRFGVSAGEDGKCLVHVIEGDVEVNRLDTGESKRLKTGQRADYGGLLQSQLLPNSNDSTDAEPDRWLPGPLGEDRDGWQLVTTAFGRGQDGYIHSNASLKITGAEPFFRVKHTTLDTSLERKGYVAFDLSRFAGKKIAESELVLHLEPSDLGYASLVPDAEFAVYGLIDGKQDRWSETDLRWDSAPAHSTAPEHHSTPVATEVVRLGTIKVPQGTQRGAVRLRNPDLTAFLSSDTNRLITFIICRETDETAKSGLVHAFATKENTHNTPPMLRLKLAER